MAEKTFPAFLAHVQPAILRIWQEAHDHIISIRSVHRIPSTKRDLSGCWKAGIIFIRRNQLRRSKVSQCTGFYIKYLFNISTTHLDSKPVASQRLWNKRKVSCDRMISSEYRFPYWKYVHIDTFICKGGGLCKFWNTAELFWAGNWMGI